VPPFKFVKEDAGGTSPKVTVSDARGREWIVKLGPEAKPETFATRLVWASGYFADSAYLVPEGSFENTGSLGRAAAWIQEGRFRDARFELRDPNVRYLTGRHWSLTEQSLQETKELGGLKALIALLSNWDIKADNMIVVDVRGQQMYAVTDWGRTMGRAEDRTGRSEWDCAKYAQDSERFVQDVQNGFVTLNYAGKQRHEVLRGVRVEHVKWLAERLGAITDSQLNAALAASGATAEQAACFVPAMRKRIAQLATAGTVTPDGEVIRSRKVIRKTVETTPLPQR
jgi:hypothetical protein